MNCHLTIVLRSMPRSLSLFLAWLALVATTSAAPLTRIAATSLRLPSTALSYNYATEPAFGGLTFPEPTLVVFAPGETTRAFILERAGRVAVVRDTTAPTREIFLDLTAKVGNGAAGNENGLLSLAFHPQFATNGYFYVWHSLYVAGTRYNRLARYTRSTTNPNVADPSSELPLITQQTGPGGHDGGMLLFGPDGYLYLSLGDGDSGYAPAVNSHQRIDESFFGCVIRIDVDQKPGNLLPNPHPSVHVGTYRVPADNPWVGATSFNGLAVTPTAVRTEFWAVGLRNPFRLTFDEPTGALWCADVGLDLREEINLITRGANYGWDFREGTTGGPRASAAPAGFTSTAPIFEYDHSLGLSITGGVLYRGAKFAELQGRYLFSDYVSGRIWALADNGARPIPTTQVKQLASEVGLVAFTTDPRTGDILLSDLDSNIIRRLVAVPASGTTIPATLSATGAFTDLATLTPAPGVVAYEPNVSFWSDYAKKSRWFALPNLTSHFGFNATANWSFPTGAVWVKHFDLELTRGDPTTSRRIETRFLVKTADSVYGLTYRWNDAQTDATLVPEDGTDQIFQIKENGATRPQLWHFPGRGECLQCHTPAGGYALSFNTRQLNRTFPADPTAHQLTSLAVAGYLDVATLPTPTTALPALAPADNIFSSTEKRARSYIDANCAQCHQPGGLGRGNWDARYATATPAANLVNGLHIETRGDSANRVIVPGDATHSMALSRLRATGALRMPPLASNELDPVGTALITQWIASLAPTPADRLVNLAARAAAGLDSDTLTTGIVISGAPKTILIRAIGPSLAQFDVAGALAQPTLTLRPLNSETVLATNTRWGGTAELRAAFAATGAFPLLDGSADSALLVNLAPGGYTAQATGVGRTAGVALIEAYDADTGTPIGRLANTSVRARVGVDAEILIPGLTIGGTAPRTVLIRAAGPALTAFNVADALTTPVLKIFSGQQPLATNTGWTTAPNLPELRAAITSAGAFAFAESSADSALLVTLAPGGYTIQVSGANRTSGVALVEVYEVP
jgi:uncharacterized repeat protein (TIGR03806 family)